MSTPTVAEAYLDNRQAAAYLGIDYDRWRDLYHTSGAKPDGYVGTRARWKRETLDRYVRAGLFRKSA